MDCVDSTSKKAGKELFDYFSGNEKNILHPYQFDIDVLRSNTIVFLMASYERDTENEYGGPHIFLELRANDDPLPTETRYIHMAELTLGNITATVRSIIEEYFLQKQTFFVNLS